MTTMTPEVMRGVAYARLRLPRYTGRKVTHYFHRRDKMPPLKVPGTIALDPVLGVFKRGHRDVPLAAPVDRRHKAPRAGSIATIGEILASK